MPELVVAEAERQRRSASATTSSGIICASTRSRRTQVRAAETLPIERAGERPGLFGEGACEAADVDGLLACRGALDRALGDALHDRGDAEEAVDHVEFPLRDPVAPGAPAIG